MRSCTITQGLSSHLFQQPISNIGKLMLSAHKYNSFNFLHSEKHAIKYVLVRLQPKSVNN